jgi:serine/threonine-protein kinase
MGQLDHPGIPPVYELGEDAKGAPFIAMKLIHGESLGQIIGRLRAGDEKVHATYSFDRRVSIGISLCDALSYVHKLGWIHCDIKPDNIMIGPYGEVLLTDWGLARRIGDPKGEEESMGAPGFCPPEQVTDANNLDGRADLFALGATLYEFFSLRPAFEGVNVSLILGNLLNTEPPMADGFNHAVQGRVPREIAYVLVRALQKDKEKRFQSAGEFRGALQAVSDGDFPVQCLCTGTKRTLSALAEFIDEYRGLAATLVIGWFFAPLLLAVGMWYLLPH